MQLRELKLNPNDFHVWKDVKNLFMKNAISNIWIFDSMKYITIIELDQFWFN